VQYDYPVKRVMEAVAARQEQQQAEASTIEQELRPKAQILLLNLLQARTDAMRLFEEANGLQQKAETLYRQEDYKEAQQIYLHIIELYAHEHKKRGQSYYTPRDLPLLSATIDAAMFLAQLLQLTEATELSQQAHLLSQRIYEYEQIDFDTLTYYDLAEQAVQRGQIAKAEMDFAKLMRVFAERYGAEDARIALVLNARANFALQTKRDFALAELLLLEALDLRRSNFEPRHPLQATTWLMLAITYLWQQRYEDAEQALRRVEHLRSLRLIITDTDALHKDVHDLEILSIRLSILNAALRAAAPLQERLQTIGQNLAGHMQDRASGKGLQEAEAYIHRLQEEANQNDEQTEVRPGLQQLPQVSLLQSHEKYAEAELLARQIIENTEKMYGPNHMTIAPALSALARVYQQQNKYEETIQCYRRVANIYEDLYGPEHTHTTSTQSLLASTLLDAGNDEEAEQICLHLLALSKKKAATKQPANPLPLRCLARIYLKQQRYEEAETYARRLLLNMEQKWGAQHIALCEALGLLTRAVLRQRRYVEADLFYQRVLAISGTRTATEAPATRHAMEQWENDLKRDYRTWLQELQSE
jgi:tetratricopeptide (TPR) repeat protein